MKTKEGQNIQRVKKLPQWMYKGLGINGGGDLIGRVMINGRSKRIYVSWEGINGTRSTPGYFPMETDTKGFDDNGRLRPALTWHRLSANGGWITI